ncbi:MAG: JAB domain-containing protein [Sphingomonas sp.]
MTGRQIVDFDAARLLFAPIGRQRREVAVFAYLDPRWQLLGLRHAPGDCSDAVVLPVREVVRDALALEATRVVMAHNHPGGDPEPSEADRATTRQLARTLDAIGIALFDHLVLAGTRVASFRAMGLL